MVKKLEPVLGSNDQSNIKNLINEVVTGKIKI